MLVDIRAGLNSTEQGVSLDSSGELTHLMVCGAGIGQHVCLSKDFVLIQNNQYSFLLLSHICTKGYEKSLKLLNS